MSKQNFDQIVGAAARAVTVSRWRCCPRTRWVLRGAGKMHLVRLVRLSASATSNVCNSYQIKHLTFVYTLSLPLTLLISFFPYSKPNNTCSKRNRRGSSASVIFTQNNVTDQLKP